MVAEYSKEYSTFIRESNELSKKLRGVDEKITSGIQDGTISEEQIKQEMETLKAVITTFQEKYQLT